MIVNALLVFVFKSLKFIDAILEYFWGLLGEGGRQLLYLKSFGFQDKIWGSNYYYKEGSKMSEWKYSVKEN